MFILSSLSLSLSTYVGVDRGVKEDEEKMVWLSRLDAVDQNEQADGLLTPQALQINSSG